MDLLMIVRKIWRYRLVTLPVILLTLFGGAYVVVAKDSVYEASASYVLINPPPPPTAEEIARRPALGRINADNPYTRFTDESVVVQVLASTVSSESAQQALMEAGGDDRYTVEPGAEFGYSSPIVDITGVGSSPKAAIRTAEAVGNAVIKELERMQQARGIDPGYQIKTQLVNAPDDAKLKAADQIRVLVVVLALGAVLLFVVVSVGDAVTMLRAERRTDPLAADDETVVPSREADGANGAARDKKRHPLAADDETVVASREADASIEPRPGAIRLVSRFKSRGDGR
jgi:hypothetical protein